MKCVVLLLSLLFTSFIDIEAFTSRTQKQSKRTHFAPGAAANSASNTSLFADKCSDSDTLSSLSEGNNNMTAADTMLFGRFKILANQVSSPVITSVSTLLCMLFVLRLIALLISSRKSDLSQNRALFCVGKSTASCPRTCACCVQSNCTIDG